MAWKLEELSMFWKQQHSEEMYPTMCLSLSHC